MCAECKLQKRTKEILMYTNKKLGGSTIALVVVSVLLAMSLSLGITLAWFYGVDSGSNNLTFAQAFSVIVDDTNGAAGGDFALTTPGTTVIPGQEIGMDIDFTISDTNIPVVLRAAFTFSVSNYTPVGEEMTLAALNTALNNAVQAEALANGWFFSGTHYYYFGHIAGKTHIQGSGTAISGAIHDKPYTATTANRSTTATTSMVLSSIYTSGSTQTVMFLDTTDIITLPYTLTNSIAGATLNISVRVEAVQDLIEGGAPTITNTATAFAQVAAVVLP